VNRHARLKKAERCLAKLPRAVLGMRQLQGRSREDVLEAVRAALRPESGPVLDKILALIEEHRRTYCKKQACCYGFFDWLDYLGTGQALLPETIPNRVMQVWRDELERHRTQTGASPAVRCLRCGMVLPGRVPDPGWPLSGTWKRCPICGSEDHAGREWSEGEGWIWKKGKRRYAIRNGFAVPE
jgi:hypothetical protein